MYLKLVVFSILFYGGILVASEWNIPIAGSNHDSSDTTNRMMMEILMGCYADLQEIVIHGSSDELIVELIRETESFAVIVFNETSIINETPHPRTKLNLFLMTPHSEEQLSEMLLTFKYSLWWNIKSPFFILDRSNDKCNNARDMLDITWKINLIDSFFLCINSDEIPMVYTYNPYTNRAPDLWTEIPRMMEQSHGWTLYSRRHHTENICDNLNFDRTKHLDGSMIRAAASFAETMTWGEDEDFDTSIIPFLHDDVRRFVKLLEYSLNTTVIFHMGQSGTTHEHVDDGSCDIDLNYLVAERKGYPVVYATYHIITNNRGFYSLLEKIENYYGLVTLISMCIIVMTTYIVIILFENRKNWSFATFEILRLLINAALRSRMRTIALRIFYTMILLYFMVLHVTFSGNLAAFLTKAEPRPGPESLHDLADPRYDEIHIPWTMELYMMDPILKEKMIVTGYSCLEAIIGKPSAVCITTSTHFLIPAFEYKFYVSKNAVHKDISIYINRNDWPLEERYSKFLMLLESSGQTNRRTLAKWEEGIRDEQKRIAAMSEVHFRSIGLNILDFIFIFLLIGLVLASIIFLCEIKIRKETLTRWDDKLVRWNRKSKRNRRVLRNRRVTRRA